MCALQVLTGLRFGDAYLLLSLVDLKAHASKSKET